MTEPRGKTTWSHFSVQFVIAVFGGALVGLLVSVIGRYLFHLDWNPFGGMPWGIMAAAVALSFRHAIVSEPGKKSQAES